MKSVYKIHTAQVPFQSVSISKAMPEKEILVFITESELNPRMLNRIGAEKAPDYATVLPNAYEKVVALTETVVRDLNNIADNPEFENDFSKCFFYELFAALNLLPKPKMYILLKDNYITEEWTEDPESVVGHTYEMEHEIGAGMSAVIASHASLSSWLRFSQDYSPVTQFMIRHWARCSFRKVICRATREQFEVAKEHEDHHITTESACNHSEVAITFLPRYDGDLGYLSRLPLYK